MSFIEFHDVKKIYKMGEVTIEAVSGVDFAIEKGEFCVIVGPSGAGKTTVLNILGGMDSCTSGKVVVDGTEVSAFSKKQPSTHALTVILAKITIYITHFHPTYAF